MKKIIYERDWYLTCLGLFSTVVWLAILYHYNPNLLNPSEERISGMLTGFVLVALACLNYFCVLKWAVRKYEVEAKEVAD